MKKDDKKEKFRKQENQTEQFHVWNGERGLSFTAGQREL